MDDWAQSIGIFALAFVYIIDRTITSLKSRGIDLQKISTQVDDLHKVDYPKLQQQINDLYRWHDVADADGIKVWYVRRSLEEAIKALAVATEKQTELFNSMDQRLYRIEICTEKLTTIANADGQ